MIHFSLHKDVVSIRVVLKNGLCPLARQLCKGGCPVGLRRELWSKALAVDTTNQEVSLDWDTM